MEIVVLRAYGDLFLMTQRALWIVIIPVLSRGYASMMFQEG